MTAKRGEAAVKRGEMPVITHSSAAAVPAADLVMPPSITASAEDAERSIAARRLVERFRQEAPRYSITSVSFSFMSPKFIREQLAVIKCSTPNLEGWYSINSPYMGTVDQNSACQTCHLVGIDCPGHHGYIDLAVPLPNPLVIGLIVEVLRCICSNCGRVLWPMDRRKDPRIMRLKGCARIREIAKEIASAPATPCPRNQELASSRIQREAAVEGSQAGDDDTVSDVHTKQYEKCPQIKIKYSLPTNPSDWNITMTVTSQSGAKITKHMPIERIIWLFAAIPKADLRFLGFSGNSHPSNFIMEALPVIPECNRPPVDRDGERRHDHLTLTYQRIIRNNTRVAECLKLKKRGDASAEVNLSTMIQDLYFDISHLISNSDGELRLHRDDPAFTVGARLAGKEGFCRTTAQGKRGNYAGRSIIGPGILPFGAAYLPEVMRVLTIPERVNEFNIERIQRQAEKGEIIHLTRASGLDRGCRRRLPKLLADAKRRGVQFPPIRIGDLVHRLAQRGDVCLLNRQPTLHRHSIIATRALFNPRQRTIKIHMSYTTPTNADFDGDEMSMSMIQTLRARAECLHLLAAGKQIISTANALPVFGVVFDCPTSAYLLSSDADADDINFQTTGKRQHTISPALWSEIVESRLEDDLYASTLPRRLREAGVAPGSPRALFSLVLPSTLYYRRRYTEDVIVRDPATGEVVMNVDGGEPDMPKMRSIKKDVFIKNGVFIRGSLTKEDISRGIVQEIWTRYGSDKAARYISEATFILEFYIENRGFSIGLSDCLLSDRAAAKATVNAKILRVRSEIMALTATPPANETEKLFREIEIRSILDTVHKVGAGLSSSEIAGRNNPLGIMITSGAKGAHKNMAQISGALGQQFINGERPRTMLYGNRTLPYFEADDDSIEAHGFIRRSFADGMDPAGFMFHMSASRIGLLDTAIHTSDIGTLTHRCQKVLENDRIGPTGGVVTSIETYTSLSYGEGYTPRELMLVKGFVSTGDVYMPFNLHKLVDELNELA